MNVAQRAENASDNQYDHVFASVRASGLSLPTDDGPSIRAAIVAMIRFATLMATLIACGVVMPPALARLSDGLEVWTIHDWPVVVVWPAGLLALAMALLAGLRKTLWSWPTDLAHSKASP